MNVKRVVKWSVFTIILIIALSTCGMKTITTGNVGVYTTLGNINPTETGPGLKFFFRPTTSLTEFTAKEIEIALEDMRPKANDNLSLKSMDVSVWYKASSVAVAELWAKYAAASIFVESAGWGPAYNVVLKEARDAAYSTVATRESLEIHRDREGVALDIMSRLQASLDEDDPGIFTITRVVVRAVETDPSIEDAIQQAIKNQKTLEAKKVAVQIATENAKIEIEKAKGIAEANRIINETLTREYLQHELNEALKAFAGTGANTVVVPYGMQDMGVMIDQLSRIRPE